MAAVSSLQEGLDNTQEVLLTVEIALAVEET